VSQAVEETARWLTQFFTLKRRRFGWVMMAFASEHMAPGVLSHSSVLSIHRLLFSHCLFVISCVFSLSFYPISHEKSMIKYQNY
jgi:hypothetical protein